MSKSKRIIITGASSGIGKAIALSLAEKNHSLVLVARRVDVLMEVAKACLDKGADAATVAGLDLSKSDQASKLLTHLDELGNGEQVLINNAGTAKFGHFADMPFEDHMSQIQLNLIGLMETTYQVLPGMLKAGSGQIINILSIVATQVLPGTEAYSASKAGALAFARSLSASYRKQGIRVTNVLPGATDTPIWGDEGPSKGDMLRSLSIGRIVRDLVIAPADHVVDEVTVTPPRGLL